MAKIPQVTPRDMASKVSKVATTHEAIQQGIRERATQHEAYLRSRDAHLNAAAKLAGKA